VTGASPAPEQPAQSYFGRPAADRLVRPATIAEAITAQAQAQGSRPYLTGVSGEGAERTLSYRELDVLSGRLAAWLAAELDARPGSVFGLLPVNDLHSVLAYFALLRSGCPVLVLNPRDPAARLTQQAAVLKPRALLCGAEVETADGVDVVRLPDPWSLPDPRLPWTDPELDPAGDALYFGTSGSTAASKLVAQSHYSIAVNAEAVRRHHALGPGSRLLGCLPVHHVNGLHFTVLATFAAGAHAVLAESFDMFGYPKLIETYRPQIASVVPSILEALVATWRSPEPPPGLSYFVSAAAPLAAGTARAVVDRLGVQVLQGYGLTETTNFSATMPRGLTDRQYRRLMTDTDTPSIGTAFYGNELAVLAPDGSRLPPGEQGELCMRGHNLMSRYQGNPEATAEAFAGGWFHSQDLGRELRDEESGASYFVVTGRTKNIAKVRGESVSLEEMERTLRAVPGVRDAACAAVADVFLGETIVAAVVASPDEVADAVLLQRLALDFAQAVLPTRFLRLPQVPRTPTGKILRPDLAALVRAAG
jgi:acyl-CoA synthetase (AMP-forming)/AMP-acid ligase II